MSMVEGEPEYDWGCEYCRNDGRLVHGRCPKCDAEYHDDDAMIAAAREE